MRKEPFRREITSGASRNYEAENSDLRARLRAFTREAGKNEAILKRTQERELDLLQADSLPVLLRLLVQGLSESYSLDAASLAIRDPQHEIRHLLLGGSERIEDYPGVMLVDSLSVIAPAFGALRRPWLGLYSPVDHRQLFSQGRTVRSVALIPLLRQQTLIGVLNFGSVDEKRFTRHHGTDFLAHLGIIAAVCLENAVNHARLLRSGMTDFLTGWHNRRYLHTRMREELARAQRQGTSVACLMVDVDHFKEVNDEFGHLGGDRMLRELTKRIAGHIRASDTAARFGGDELAILLPDTDVPSAAMLAERIRQSACSRAIDLGESRAHTPSLSIGVAAVQPPREQSDLKTVADQLLAEADAALYRAKAEGRGRVEV